MLELKPCPYCGSEDIYIGIPTSSTTAIVECEECGAVIEIDIQEYIDLEDLEELATCKCIRCWNRRINDWWGKDG